MTTVVLLRFGSDGFERFAASRPAFDADLLAQLRAAIAASLPLPRVSCYGRAGAIDDPPAVAVECGGGTGEQAIARPSGAASDCGPARASASQCKLARASAGKQARANASQRETARSSASQREQTRARGSHRKRELARGAWGGAYRANARRKGANDPHILNFFLKGGLSQNFPKYKIWGNSLFTRKNVL